MGLGWYRVKDRPLRSLMQKAKCPLTMLGVADVRSSEARMESPTF